MANRSGYLQVQESPPHKIFWAEYGNSLGEPVIYLHGGPGASASSSFAEYFDSRRYRIILFEQRGCGDSKPNANGDDPAEVLTDNTTQHSINDILRLRQFLGVRGPMHLAGGSWGTTLAMAYAIRYPETVKSLLLRGVFLGRREDVDFCFQGNAEERDQKPIPKTAMVIPTSWRRFASTVRPREYEALVAALQEIFALAKNRRASLPSYSRIKVGWRTFADTITTNQQNDLFNVLREIFKPRLPIVAGTYNTFRGPWDRFVDLIPAESRADVAKYLARELIKIPKDDQEKESMINLAKAFIGYQNSISGVRRDEDSVDLGGDGSLGYARILLHYTMNGYFLGGSGNRNRDNNYILQHLYRLKDIPFFIVHGRYDNACNPQQAHDLVEGLRLAGNQQVEFVVSSSGHSGFESDTYEKLRIFARKLPNMYTYEIDRFPPLKITRKITKKKAKMTKRPPSLRKQFDKVRQFKKLDRQ